MTIKDVAQLSGYAVGTVSRVLNGRSDVSEEARTRILSVVESTGFKPNANARHLKQRESGSIAIIVKGAGNLLFAGILEEMQSRLKATGRAVAVYYLDENDDEVALAMQVRRELKPLGILFLGGNRDNFIRGFPQTCCPCVLVTTRADNMGYGELSSVSTDDMEGAGAAAHYLAAAGHRCIGVIGGVTGGGNISQIRLRGYQYALEEEGIAFDVQRQFQPSRFSMEGGYEAALALLDRCPELTAIIAMSDVMAIGALRAIHDRGLRVPEDISLIGYDGIDQANYCVPRLTTIRQDMEQLARRGVDILMQRTNGGQVVHEIIPFRLLEGESVRQITP